MSSPHDMVDTSAPVYMEEQWIDSAGICHVSIFEPGKTNAVESYSYPVGVGPWTPIVGPKGIDQ